MFYSIITVFFSKSNSSMILFNPQTVDDVYENLENYNPSKKRKVLMVFDDMIADMEANKKLSNVVTELLLRERKLNISFVFMSQSYFKVSKAIKN